MNLGIDLTPLRASRQYRRLYVAGFVSALGSQATYVTTAYQLKQLTHSPLAVGALGLVEVVPLLVFGLYGGVLADHFDRRRLVLLTEFVLLLTAVALLVNAARPSPAAWVLYVVDAVIVIAGSVQGPSIAALNQRLVAHDLQREAATLNMVRGTFASIVGPALGGFIAVAAGPSWVYAINVATFVASLGLLVTLAPVGRGGGDGATVSSLLVGLRYARSRPDIVGTYVVDLLAMALAYPVVMMPFVAERFSEHYALALLYLGLPVGALLATLTSIWTRRVHRYGRAVVAAAVLWGLGIAVFGYSTSLAVVLGGLVVAGGADAVSGIFRNTMWNESIPPDVRGRMAGVELISYSLGPTAGQFRSGLMTAWTSLRFSLSVGGLASAGSVAVVVAALPQLWAFDARSDAHVAEVRALRGAEDAER